MSFDSWSEFVAMGGHGLYVWLSYGAALIIVAWNLLSVRVGFQRHVQQVRDRQRRQAHAAAPLPNTHPTSGEPEHR